MLLTLGLVEALLTESVNGPSLQAFANQAHADTEQRHHQTQRSAAGTNEKQVSHQFHFSEK